MVGEDELEGILSKFFVFSQLGAVYFFVCFFFFFFFYYPVNIIVSDMSNASIYTKMTLNKAISSKGGYEGVLYDKELNIIMSLFGAFSDSNFIVFSSNRPGSLLVEKKSCVRGVHKGNADC